MTASLAVVVVVMVLGSGWSASGATHHVADADQGWDAANSAIASWSTGRSFTVGDGIWFTYSAALERIVELGSQAKYESCDTSNPIRMYTNVMDRVELKQQGPHYFASAMPENCNRGHKLHIQVGQDQTLAQAQAVVGAAGPKPSSVVRVQSSNWFGLALLCIVCFVQRL